ncbi:hypothetical protein Q4F19_11050 [Sphingomonas sp. BIUV-7]|uniref:Outer membrane protein beta-barrel domain-containing protein n=1 Tax=Sphingomonas natans TaxID=3063330 RepID=A0ABT8Y9B0_9SPHN|nr:hypothetical protein [Sphingomonas sp. BIUV-7]MDO6414919.1 hypothetical protein [Sphingomonas sp. BIUV-7]
MTTQANMFVAAAAILLMPTAQAPRPFTGTYALASTGEGGRGGGWDFAPLPGIRVGVDAQVHRPRPPAYPAASPKSRPVSFAVGGRLGAVIDRSTLVYVRAGYAAPEQQRRGLLLDAGIERVGQSGGAIRREIRVASYRSGRGERSVERRTCRA